LSALVHLIAQARAQKAAGAAASAASWSDLEIARRIAFILDRRDRAVAALPPAERAGLLVEDTFARADELVDADPAVAEILARAFTEAAAALQAEVAA
jgi:hypothetical protein